MTKYLKEKERIMVSNSSNDFFFSIKGPVVVAKVVVVRQGT